jgi:glycine cleavage system H protein
MALAGGAHAQTQTKTGETTVDEVIVTAEKRSESLQDVPVAVTAVTAETLQNAGITDVRLLQAVVPSYRVSAGESCAVVESVKAASDVYSPVSGEVVAGNADLGGQPELINQDPYGTGWIMRIRPEDKAQFAVLLDAKAYEAALAAETH